MDRERIAWCAEQELALGSGGIAPKSVVPGRLPISRKQTFGQVGR
jgi:hypothetical protein